MKSSKYSYHNCTISTFIANNSIVHDTDYGRPMHSGSEGTDSLRKESDQKLATL